MKSYKIIKKQKIDLILGDFTLSGIYLLLLKILTKTPYIIGEHNIEFELVKFNYKLTGRLISPAVKIYEKIIWKFSKYIFCVSDNDKKTIVNLGIKPEKVFVLKDGTDDNYLEKSDMKELKRKINLNSNYKIILFFGKLDYIPNREAVDIIYEKILPKVLKKTEKIKFLIVGSNPPKIKNKYLIFTGPVKDIKKYIYASDIVICPLLHGEGIRLKIIESVGCGRPVISTTVGAGELAYEKLNNYLTIKDDWDEFTEEIIKAFNIKKRAKPTNFLDKYLWGKIFKRINEKLK